jgi:hypothetical protein
MCEVGKLRMSETSRRWKVCFLQVLYETGTRETS